MNTATLTHIEIINRLVGKVYPIGQASVDEERFKNLQLKCEIASKILEDIEQISFLYKDSHEHSLKRAGEYAKEFIKNIKEI